MSGPLAGIVLIFPLTCIATADSWAPLSDGWSRYTNERFGTVIEVPLRIFNVTEPASSNGDGLEFRAEDGSRFSVYGTYAPYAVMVRFDEYTEHLLIEAQAKGLALTYRKGGKGWAVFSGHQGANIVYTRGLRGSARVQHRVSLLKQEAVRSCRRAPVTHSELPASTAQEAIEPRWVKPSPHCRAAGRKCLPINCSEIERCIVPVGSR